MFKFLDIYIYTMLLVVSVKSSGYEISENEVDDDYNDYNQINLGDFGRRITPVNRSPSPPLTRATGQYSYKDGAADGPNNWSSFAPECAGTHQSPININTDLLKFDTRDCADRLKFNGFFDIPRDIVLKNDGHAVRIEFDWIDVIPTITGGPLDDKVYEFNHMHFHFGEYNDVGSEHKINNIAYPMEVHMVFFNKAYGTLENALNYDDGLSVMGFFYKISNEIITHSFIKYLTLIKRNEQAHSLYNRDLFTLQQVIGKMNFDYVSYQGSLTTPGCNEIVTWIVSLNKIPITNQQMKTYRTVLDNHGEKMANNYRPVQDLNDREYYYYSANC